MIAAATYLRPLRRIVALIALALLLLVRVAPSCDAMKMHADIIPAATAICPGMPAPASKADKPGACAMTSCAALAVLPTVPLAPHAGAASAVRPGATASTVGFHQMPEIPPPRVA